MKLFYDFHIHTALSPCADDDNTPNNIVNMCLIKGLNAIAISDHNTGKNVRATMAVGEKSGLLVMPAMELTTEEEIHILCIFENADQLDEFENFVDRHRMKINNDEASFGKQLIMNENDEVVATYPYLLFLATSISVDDVSKIVSNYGGIAIPAHIDRPYNSIMGVLGQFNYDIGFSIIECKHEVDDVSLPRIVNSDAHYLVDINEPENYIEVEECTAKAVISALKNLKTVVDKEI